MPSSTESSVVDIVRLYACLFKMAAICAAILAANIGVALPGVVISTLRASYRATQRGRVTDR